MESRNFRIKESINNVYKKEKKKESRKVMRKNKATFIEYRQKTVVKSCRKIKGNKNKEEKKFEGKSEKKNLRKHLRKKLCHGVKVKQKI